MIDEKYLQTIIENASKAGNQWDQFAKVCTDINSFKKKFHLRPTHSGVTIISTIEEKPMRGIKCGKTKVEDRLRKLAKAIELGDTKNQMELLGFQNRKISKQKKAEEVYQARMIAGMAENQSLKDYLKVDQLTFIASEFILHDSYDKSDRLRVDIIGFGSKSGKNRLFFFELKEPCNTKDDPVAQVQRYIDIYRGEKSKPMLEVLKKYPINAVTSDDVDIEGYAVYGYGSKIDLNESKMLSTQTGVIKFEDWGL